MASGSDTWLDERRSWGIVSAVAASVVGAMSLIDLDEVFLRDIVTVIAAVGVVPRLRRRAAVPGVGAVRCRPVVAATTMNLPELANRGRDVLRRAGLVAPRADRAAPPDRVRAVE